MIAARDLVPDPAERGLRLLAEMFEHAASAASAERPILRIVGPEDRAAEEV